MRSLSRLYLLFKTVTTAKLSQLEVTLFPCRSGPQTNAAIRIGINSFTAMCFWQILLSHSNWNHSLSYHAPQPHVPDASNVIVTSGGPCGIITAIHFSANNLHHHISDRNSAFSRIWWCFCLATLRSAKVRHRKDRPGWIAFNACCNVPIRDSNSLLVYVRFW